MFPQVSKGAIPIGVAAQACCLISGTVGKDPDLWQLTKGLGMWAHPMFGTLGLILQLFEEGWPPSVLMKVA